MLSTLVYPLMTTCPSTISASSPLSLSFCNTSSTVSASVILIVTVSVAGFSADFNVGVPVPEKSHMSLEKPRLVQIPTGSSESVNFALPVLIAEEELFPKTLAAVLVWYKLFFTVPSLIYPTIPPLLLLVVVTVPAAYEFSIKAVVPRKTPTSPPV